MTLPQSGRAGRLGLGVATALALLGLPAACGGSHHGPAQGITGRVPSFSRIVVVVFENKDAGEVLGNRSVPTFNRLARSYAALTRYYGVTHPSLPNYLALVSGSTQGITNDCTSCVVDAPSLADTLESAGKTWKTYAEGLPAAGSTEEGELPYAKWHNPFVYFRAVFERPDRLARVVPLDRFQDDLSRGALPDFSLVIPDRCHDMHDCPVSEGDAWLNGFLEPLLGSTALEGGAVFVIFDEGHGDEGGGGHVPALALGPLVRPGARLERRVTHYGLLRTVEDAWTLPHLGGSRSASPVTGIWRSSAFAAG